MLAVLINDDCSYNIINVGVCYVILYPNSQANLHFKNWPGAVSLGTKARNCAICEENRKSPVVEVCT